MSDFNFNDNQSTNFTSGNQNYMQNQSTVNPQKKSKAIPIIVAVLLAAVLVFGVVMGVAMVSSKQNSSGNNANYSNNGGTSGSTANKSDFDLPVTIGDKTYNFPVLWSDFENDGWEFTDRNHGVGVDGLYGYDPYSFDNYIDTYVYNDNMYLSDIEIYLCNYKQSTAQWEECQVAGMRIGIHDANGLNVSVNGIVLGESTRADVEQIYGSPVDENTFYCKYYLIEYGNEQNVLKITYDDNDYVERLDFVNVIANKFEDNSAVSGSSSDYNVKPTSLSDDIYDFQFKINGEIYQMPVTPQAFLDNDGYYADEDVLNTVVASNTTAEVDITYDGRTSTLKVANFTNNAMKIRDCSVQTINMGYDGGAFRDFEIFNGFTYGSDAEELWNYIDADPNTQYRFENQVYSDRYGDDIYWSFNFTDSRKLKSVTIDTWSDYFTGNFN